MDKEIVLSISQMQELIELGIDTSKASMFWHPAFYRVNGILDYDEYEDIPRIKLENNYNLEYDILTFTLQDILEMIPSDNWRMSNNGLYCNFNNVYHKEEQPNMLLNAFNVLKWCKQNNYI